MSIEQRSLRSLEWDRLTAYLADLAETAEGKELSLKLEPQACGRLEAEILLGETDEALALIRNRSEFTLSKVFDLRESLGLLRAGGDLGALELGRVGALLSVSRQVRGSLALLADDFPRLKPYGLRLVSLNETAGAIERAIEYDTVRDEASPALRSLRREKIKLEGQVKDELGRIIQSQAGSKALQEPIFTMRGGRYVLPVMSNMRYSIDGIVHDASQSGLTVYLEPMTVVELSNQIRIAEAAVENEIARILRELSALIRKDVEAILNAYDALIELDCIMARGRLADRYDGIKPEISSGSAPRLDLIAVRHPLLVLQNKKGDVRRFSMPARDAHGPVAIAENSGEAKSDKAKAVVANDIRLKENEHTLIITGPNTGGKTVFLKLIGLTALMLRAGLLIPAGPGSTASLFNLVCADIGDEQSLEQSLSTFSAHMQNIVEIVDRASPQSGMLVLLDEVGAGTDPKEGAALARAVLEHLSANNVVTVATTHLGELKTLAFENPDFVNASFEFDEESLSPTYKLRLGMPGASKANTIAMRLGLAMSVVERARELTVSGDREFDEILKNLNDKVLSVSEKEDELKLRLEEVDFIKKKTDEERNKLKAERERLKSEVGSEMRAELKEARKIVRELTAELQKNPGMRAAQKTAAELKALEATISFLKERQKPEDGPDPNELAVGRRVKIISLNQTGHIQELGVSQGQPVFVRVGAMKIKVAPDDLRLLDNVKPSGRSQVKKVQTNEKRDNSKTTYNDPQVFVRTMNNTLDLRGQRVDQALLKVEAFVDECSVHHVSPLMIIHGHGTGAIKSAVRDFLKSCRYPSRFRPGETYEGGDGVTVVELGE